MHACAHISSLCAHSCPHAGTHSCTIHIVHVFIYCSHNTDIHRHTLPALPRLHAPACPHTHILTCMSMHTRAEPHSTQCLSALKEEILHSLAARCRPCFSEFLGNSYLGLFPLPRTRFRSAFELVLLSHPHMSPSTSLPVPFLLLLLVYLGLRKQRSHPCFGRFGPMPSGGLWLPLLVAHVCCSLALP